MARLARIPRIYKVIRILRLSKILKLYKQKQNFDDFLSRGDMSVGAVRMIKLLTLQFLMVHLFACFWYFSTTFADSPWDTWLDGRGLIGESKAYIYINAVYWAF